MHKNAGAGIDDCRRDIFCCADWTGDILTKSSMSELSAFPSVLLAIMITMIRTGFKGLPNLGHEWIVGLALFIPSVSGLRITVLVPRYLVDVLRSRSAPRISIITLQSRGFWSPSCVNYYTSRLHSLGGFQGETYISQLRLGLRLSKLILSLFPDTSTAVTMAPENTIDQKTTLHTLSHQDPRLLITGHRLSSLDIHNQPTTSYPASLSPQLVGPVSTSQEHIAPEASPLRLSPRRPYMASPTESVPFSGSLPPILDTHQSTPNPRSSAYSQSIIPPICTSTYRTFEQPFPAILDSGNPHLPFGIGLDRAPSGIATAPPQNLPLSEMIPCVLNLKSGSNSQAEKRKANSDASRRFRNRKRNELLMEQTITDQWNEIQKQSDTLQQQAKEI